MTRTGPDIRDELSMEAASQDAASPLAARNPLALESQLCFSLYSAANRMTRLYRPLLDAVGLTYPQYLTMLVLWEHDGLLVGEIGDKLGLDSGTLTPLLKRLEAAGHLTRKRDAEDERRVRIRLTDKGRALKSEVAPIPVSVACSLGLPADELVRLHALVNQFNASFD